jgi:parallel beta-helix repeat protein
MNITKKWRGFGVEKRKIAVFLVFLSLFSLCLVILKPVKSQENTIIYIGPNGSVFSSSENVTIPIQRVGDFYTFNDNIYYSSLVVQRDNIVVDGAGYSISGMDAVGIGIDLSGTSNVTIENVHVTGVFFLGIYVFNCSSNTITGNTVTNSILGIMVENASSNIVSANNLTRNDNGISVYFSSKNELRDNIMYNNRYNFGVYGTELSHFVNDIDSSNIVDGKRVYYLVNESDMDISPSVFSDLGFLALVNCRNVTLRDFDLSHNIQDVILAFSTDSTITQNQMTDTYNGLGVYSSSNNLISGNIIMNNSRGIQLSNSSGIGISENNISSNMEGIYLFGSTQNTFVGNNITNGYIGVGFSESSNNVFYGNAFVGNTKQVYDSVMMDSYVTASVNIWDLGYTIGGNYWSDYVGLDVKSGSNQDQHGSDGIGDTPFVMYGSNKDNYPLLPFGSHPLILIVSPENKTYNVNNVDLTFTVSKPTLWVRYSLDGQANVTITGNTTLSNLGDGVHSVIVYAQDLDEQTGLSETIYFSVGRQLEAFPITWIIAIIVLVVVVGAAVLLYFVKFKKKSSKIEK